MDQGVRLLTARPATPADRKTFVALWGGMLQNLEKLGVREVLLTDRSLRFYAAAFDAVVEGRVPGVCLVLERDGKIVAMSLAPEVAIGWDTGFGRCAAGMGSVVAPEERGKGIAESLLRAMRKALLEAGFDSWLGTGHLENRRSLDTYLKRGWKPYAIACRFDLHAEDSSG